MKRSDWLPPSRTEQLAMAKRWNNVLADKAAGWGVTADEKNALLNMRGMNNEEWECEEALIPIPSFLIPHF